MPYIKDNDLLVVQDSTDGEVKSLAGSAFKSDVEAIASVVVDDAGLVSKTGNSTIDGTLAVDRLRLKDDSTGEYGNLRNKDGDLAWKGKKLPNTYDVGEIVVFEGTEPPFPNGTVMTVEDEEANYPFWFKTDELKLLYYVDGDPEDPNGLTWVEVTGDSGGSEIPDGFFDQYAHLEDRVDSLSTKVDEIDVVDARVDDVNTRIDGLKLSDVTPDLINYSVNDIGVINGDHVAGFAPGKIFMYSPDGPLIEMYKNETDHQNQQEGMILKFFEDTAEIDLSSAAHDFAISLAGAQKFGVTNHEITVHDLPIKGLGAPTADDHATNRAYVDEADNAIAEELEDLREDFEDLRKTLARGNWDFKAPDPFAEPGDGEFSVMTAGYLTSNTWDGDTEWIYIKDVDKAGVDHEIENFEVGNVLEIFNEAGTSFVLYEIIGIDDSTYTFPIFQVKVSQHIGTPIVDEEYIIRAYKQTENLTEVELDERYLRKDKDQVMDGKLVIKQRSVTRSDADHLLQVKNNEGTDLLGVTESGAIRAGTTSAPFLANLDNDVVTNKYLKGNYASLSTNTFSGNNMFNNGIEINQGAVADLFIVNGQNVQFKVGRQKITAKTGALGFLATDPEDIITLRYLNENPIGGEDFLNKNTGGDIKGPLTFRPASMVSLDPRQRFIRINAGVAADAFGGGNQLTSPFGLELNADDPTYTVNDNCQIRICSANTKLMSFPGAGFAYMTAHEDFRLEKSLTFSTTEGVVDFGVSSGVIKHGGNSILHFNSDTSVKLGTGIIFNANNEFIQNPKNPETDKQVGSRGYNDARYALKAEIPAVPPHAPAQYAWKWHGDYNEMQSVPEAGYMGVTQRGLTFNADPYQGVPFHVRGTMQLENISTLITFYEDLGGNHFQPVAMFSVASVTFNQSSPHRIEVMTSNATDPALMRLDKDKTYFVTLGGVF